MKTINGITSELREKKARRKWQTRCGAFLLGVVAAWYGAHPVAMAEVTTGTVTGTETVVEPYDGANYSFSDLNIRSNFTGQNTFNTGSVLNNTYMSNDIDATLNITNGGSGAMTVAGGTFWNSGTLNILNGAVLNIGSTAAGGPTTFNGLNGVVNVNNGGTLRFVSDTVTSSAFNVFGTGVMEVSADALAHAGADLYLHDGGTIRFTDGWTGDGVSFIGPIYGNRGVLDTNGHDVTTWWIQDGVDITKIGAGTLTLSGPGGTGTKTITQGTIQFDSQYSLGTGAVIFNGTGTLYKSKEDNLFLDQLTNDIVVSGSSSIGTFYIDTTTQAEDFLGTGAMTVNLTGSFSGTGTFVKSGGGTLLIKEGDDNINKSNGTFLGDFRIDGGAVVTYAADAIGANGVAHKLIIGNGIYVADYTGSLARAVNLVNNGTADPASQFYGIGVTEGNTLTLTGIISGSGAFNKYGPGTLVLTNNTNSYTGATTIDDGILQISGGAQLGRTSEVNIGTYEDATKRPVLETTATSVINTGVNFQTAESEFRTTNASNETTVTGNVAGRGNLNKTGTGTLKLQGDGTALAGDIYIHSGTLAIQETSNLNLNTIHLGSTELTNLTDRSDAILSVYGNSDVSLGNAIILGQPATGLRNVVNVDEGSRLTLTGSISGNISSCGLTKTGLGTLYLAPVTENSYSGQTNLVGGSIVAMTQDVIKNSSSLSMAAQTLFNLGGFDQEIKDLKSTSSGGSAATAPKVLVGGNTLTLNTASVNSTYDGYILGTGTVVKKGHADSVQTAGFTINEDERFEGTFDIQSGTLRLNTDTYITGLQGNARAQLDVYDKTLTVDIAGDYNYSGLIVSTINPKGSGELVKTGVGTLTTGLASVDQGSFNGSITMQQGNLNVRGNLNMSAADGNTLTFNIDNLSTTTQHSIIDLVGATSNTKGTATFDSGTYLSVNVNDTGGWQLASGRHVVGEVYGNADSQFSQYTDAELQTHLGANDTILNADKGQSMFFQIGKMTETTATYKKLKVVVDVTGIGGVAERENAQAVGKNLDDVRISNTVPTELAKMIQAIWAYGSNINPLEQDSGTGGISTDMANRIAEINNLLVEMSGDTMANAMYLGLSRPWRTPFDRMRLEGQMMYALPGYYQPSPNTRGQAVMNMNNVWFTALTNSMDVKTDGNARSFGVSRQGFILGYDRRIAQNAAAGLSFSHSTPYLYQNKDRVHASDFQFGAYAGAMIGYYFELKGYIGYGHQCYESSRVFDTPEVFRYSGSNLSGIADPRQAANGKFSGDTFAFSLELSRPLFFGQHFILRPTLGLDSEHVYRGNFSEEGDAISLSYRNADFHRTMARMDFIGELRCDRFKAHGKLGYGFLLGGDDFAKSSSQYIGVASTGTMQSRSVAIGTSYFEAGIGGEVYLNPMKTFMLFANWDASTTDKMDSHMVTLGLQHIF